MISIAFFIVFGSHGQSFISGLCANYVLSKLNLSRFKLKFKITLSEANSSLICLIGSRATASNLATTNWPLNSLKNDQLMQLIWWAINEMLWWRQWMWNRLLHVNGFGFHCEKVGQTWLLLMLQARAISISIIIIIN